MLDPSWKRSKHKQFNKWQYTKGPFIIYSMPFGGYQLSTRNYHGLGKGLGITVIGSKLSVLQDIADLLVEKGYNFPKVHWPDEHPLKEMLCPKGFLARRKKESTDVKS